MKAILMSFQQLLLMIRKDKMLLVVCFIPILCGFIFRFGLPYFNQIIIQYIHVDLKQYYSLVDIFYGMVISDMFCIVAALVILEERDDHTINSLFVTPLGNVGYLISRLGILTILSLIITCILLPLFHLSSLSLDMMILMSILGCLQGLIASLLVVSLSSHKLEGMAVAKMASLEAFVVLIPYFFQNAYSYLFVWVPTFWIGKGLVDEDTLFMIIGLLISVLWIMILAFIFKRKLT